MCEESLSVHALVIDIVRIKSPESVETLRQIRNMASGGFTSFNGYITKQEQAVWWLTMRDRVVGWIYYDRRAAQAVGYGLVREEDGRWWNSIAVHPYYRGHGFGSFITHDVLLRCHRQPVYAAVRRDNAAARSMHRADDWEEVDGPEPERLIYLRSRQPAVAIG